MKLEIKQMETDAEIKGKAYVHWKAWHEAYPGMVDQGYLDALTLETCEEKACRWRDNLLVGKTDDRVRGILSGEEAGIRFREFPRSLACAINALNFFISAAMTFLTEMQRQQK